MRRRKVKVMPKCLSSDSSDDDEPLSKKVSEVKQTEPKPHENDSSSDSDIGNYLQPVDKLDLDSEFFNFEKDANSFDKIGRNEKKTSTLSDSGSEDDAQVSEEPSTSTFTKLNFQQLHEYTKKLEEARRHVEEYNARKQIQESQPNIQNLLAETETNLKNELQITSLNSSDFESCSDSEKEGWEEVAENWKEKDSVPKEGLQITVDMPTAVKKKKGVDLFAAIKRRLNRVRKENQVLIHKVHLLCWIGHGNYLSSVINSQNILSLALSMLPSENAYPEGRTDFKYLEQIVKWYKNAVTNTEKSVPTDKSLPELLENQIAKKEAYNKNMLVYIFVAILRALGIQCRLVLSFQVEPVRPPNSELHSLSVKPKPENNKSARLPNVDMKNRAPRSSTISQSAAEVKKKPPLESKKNTKVIKPITTPSRTDNMKTEPKGKRSTNTASSDGKLIQKNNNRSKSSSSPKTEAKVTTRSKSTSAVVKVKLERASNEKLPEKTKKIDKRKSLKIPQVDGANDTVSPTKPNLKKLKEPQAICPSKDHPKRLKTKIKYKDSDSEDDFVDSKMKNRKSSQKNNGLPNLKKVKAVTPKPADVRDDIIKIVKSRIKEQRDLDRSRTVKKRKPGPDSENDSDYVPEAAKKKHVDSDDEFKPKIKIKRRIQVKPEDNEEEKKKKRGVDVWAEVFLEDEEKWISVDVNKGQVHCINELFNRASHPVSYIVAWNNNNCLKDITRRYCQNFNTCTRNLRIGSKWWEESLKPFEGPKTARDKEEDEDLERQQVEKPLPVSIAEYKNHPLYVLKRHLLKFEALYPPDIPPIGFVKSEPVYSRQCVYTLHSREIWNKHAKVVKLGEQPYKIVKARPKWDRLSNKIITDQSLEIFGPWQTEDYDPPTAENGIVPRNAFGNVELFKPCMLPKKTVHLRLPGLNKVAKRLKIDCASAVVGFDFHGGWNHPTYDGFVVCEEFEDTLVAAWEMEQEEIEKKEREKIDKRVYGNWKKLIRGLLIRERLKKKYEFGESSGGGGNKKSKGPPKVSMKKRRIESDSE